MAKRAVAPLTDTQIKNAKSKDKDYLLADGNGLYLNIKIIGTKVWTVRYTVESTPKKTTIGNYPSVTLQQAREKAKEYQAKAKRGINPTIERKELKHIELEIKEGQFHLVAYGWLKIMETKTGDRTHKKRVSAFERDIFPTFCSYDKDRKIRNSKHIKDITHKELLKCIKDKEQSAPETAHRLLADCSRLWLYAVSNGHADFNITANISKDALVKNSVKHIPKITDEKILGELLRAIDRYSGSKITRNALRFVSILPLRRERLAQLKWECYTAPKFSNNFFTKQF